MHPMHHSTLRRAAIAAMLALTAFASIAQPDARDPPRGPPTEALEACKSLAAGKDCSFTTPQGKSLQGSCWAPEGKPLACRPKAAPGAPSPRPPG